MFTGLWLARVVIYHAVSGFDCACLCLGCRGYAVLNDVEVNCISGQHKVL